MRRLFLLLVLAPLLELYLLIKVGGALGAGWTVVLVVLTAALGVWLVRAQGISTLARVQQRLAPGNLPAVEIFEGVLLFVAGALLLTPGFFTDGAGFALLIPPLRRALVVAMIRRRMFMEGAHTRGRIIDVGEERR